MKAILEQLYGDFLERELPELIGRNVNIEPVTGKALALIGMRRTGKTYLCFQAIRNLIAQGVPKENILYLNFEDDRLYGFQLSDCQSILDVFYAQQPEKKATHCWFFFDEIQNIPDWEKFIRRVIDTEKASVYVTGSSAKLLSTEIATGLRGRALDREVFPYSFEEYLNVKHFDGDLSRLGSKTRLQLANHAQDYCNLGGFPEVHNVEPHHREEILQSYVDAVVLRDVVERRKVSNVEALRRMLFLILRNPATKFSINKFYQSLKSQGVRLSKDDLYAFLRYLEDAYLLFPISIWSRSEKKRMVNPKKVYVIDNGIVDAYSTKMTADHGAILENLVYITLRRQGLTPGYYETKRGHEVDFVYRRNEETTLVQVSYSLEDEDTKAREFRALNEAISELQPTRCIVVTISEEWTHEETGTFVIPLWKFLLNATQY